ncbi:hypothetical protein [Achromobacter insuavis]|uniref:hypothetical protein n=1 Tax=Achromobacter insuavis TaxID=1287735 RepID=UPI001F13159B|nr:hypothetical protein [Achromobacter insuavis]
MSQHQDIAAIVRNKLRDALSKTDDATHHAMRARWSAIGPAPTCPHVNDLMRDMHQAHTTGLVERNRVAKATVLEALAPIKAKLTGKDVAAVMVEVRNAFPEDTTYARMANGIPGIYQRQQAPAHKFQQQSYDTEAALMRAGSTNMGRRAIADIQHMLDEVLTQQRILKPSPWQRARSVAGRILMRPVLWMVGIVAAAAAALLTDWFKGLLGSLHF